MQTKLSINRPFVFVIGLITGLVALCCFLAAWNFSALYETDYYGYVCRGLEISVQLIGVALLFSMKGSRKLWCVIPIMTSFLALLDSVANPDATRLWLATLFIVTTVSSFLLVAASISKTPQRIAA